ncbi:hypothetical protein PDE_09132 [Penicillium oxalicum 114-2]|uniref:Uncharacterized protein n=1 Tax=Penicillium oxalicum (strain 114-2 / CGMCC 5302) TaxID=933388 RepID=S8B5M7_PENO1|nr:hypothetical protein PDE_09132 [Penicillium oxalicum 114-2]
MQYTAFIPRKRRPWWKNSDKEAGRTD